MTSPLRSAALALAALATAASAQPTDAGRPSGVPLDSLVRAYAQANGLPSLVVGVVVDGQRTVVGAGEVEGAVPDAHTLYEIGSVTKAVTSLLLADAVVRGETTLETPLADVLRAPVASHAAGPVRLVDLATHTSGWPRLDLATTLQPGFDPADPYAAYGADRLAAFLRTVPPSAAPGARHAYSNTAVGALGYALARRADTTYAALVSDRVLGPLGMAETFVAVPDSLADRLATGHDASGPVPHWTLQDATVGAGGLRSTAADMLTLAEAVVRPDETPLAEAIALTLQPRVAVAERVEQGLGWFLAELNGGGTMAFHDGGTGGFVSFVAALPQDGIGLVVLANRTGDVSGLAYEVLGRLRDARAGRGD